MLRIPLLIGLLVFTVQASNDYVNYPEVQQSYKFHRAPQKWSDAKDTCRRENATLAMPKNEAEVEVLKKIFSGYPSSMLRGVTHPDYILLGFHDMFQEGEFLTNKGVPLQYFYHKWFNGQPDNYNDNENCGTLRRDGGLNDYSCDISAVFICQKNKKKDENSTDFKCLSPDPGYKYSNLTEKCYKLHLNPRVWSEARALCQAEGGNLAIINNKIEEQFLSDMFRSTKNIANNIRHKDYALLGFHDIFQEHHYMTVEDDELQNTGYTNWASGQPDNAGGNEDCGSMHISGGLNDYACTIPALFFCEIEANVYPTLDQRFSNR